MERSSNMIASKDDGAGQVDDIMFGFRPELYLKSLHTMCISGILVKYRIPIRSSFTSFLKTRGKCKVFASSDNICHTSSIVSREINCKFNVLTNATGKRF